MKTTVELSDQLARDAKSFARAHGVTLRELIERGLRHELQRRAEPTDFSWDPIVVGEPGDQIPTRPPHELAYEDPDELATRG